MCAGSKPTPAKVTKADAQKVLRIISSDKAKTRIYCDMNKLGEQIEQANEKNDNKMVNELSEKLEALGEKLGPEYTALMDGLPDIDQDSEVGQEIESVLLSLDRLCMG
jgi:mevalonate kinase